MVVRCCWLSVVGCGWLLLVVMVGCRRLLVVVRCCWFVVVVVVGLWVVVGCVRLLVIGCDRFSIVVAGWLSVAVFGRCVLFVLVVGCGPLLFLSFCWWPFMVDDCDCFMVGVGCCLLFVVAIYCSLVVGWFTCLLFFVVGCWLLFARVAGRLLVVGLLLFFVVVCCCGCWLFGG